MIKKIKKMPKGLFAFIFGLSLLSGCDLYKHETVHTPTSACLLVSGTVTDANYNPIKGIRVDAGSRKTATFTDVNGNYSIRYQGTIFLMSCLLSINDIDGKANGGEFESQSLSLYFDNDDLIQLDGNGHKTMEKKGTNITLKLKNSL